MPIRRLAALPAGVSLVAGLAMLAMLLVLVPADVRPWTAVAAVVALAASSLASGLTSLALGRALAADFVARLGHMEDRLRASVAQAEHDHAEMASIFEHLADGVLVLDGREQVVVSNPAAARLLRQPRLQGRPLAAATRDGELVQVARAAADETTVTQAIELRPAGGGPRWWLQVVATRLPSERRMLIVLQDVTELRHAEAARRDFVANVSHELRTPVASLKALVETLEAGALRDPHAGPDFLRRMHVEVDGLAQLVSELLELARIEAGRLQLDLSVCRAEELVVTAVERVRPFAARLEITVNAEASGGSALWVRADARRIGQVLSNLLANAVKFTPPGGRITAGASMCDTGVEVWVSDTGVGIPPDQLLRVFERFYKTDPSRTGSGTGLGLAICKHIVRSHGGSIWAESAGPGRGATFRFTLPLAVPEEEPSSLDVAPAVLSW